MGMYFILMASCQSKKTGNPGLVLVEAISMLLSVLCNFYDHMSSVRMKTYEKCITPFHFFRITPGLDVFEREKKYFYFRRDQYEYAGITPTFSIVYGINKGTILKIAL